MVHSLSTLYRSWAFKVTTWLILAAIAGGLTVMVWIASAVKPAKSAVKVASNANQNQDGAVTIAENHHFLKRGIIIYLRAEIDIQYERTYRDRNRPLLQIDNPKQKLTELFCKRDPIYQQLADITIVTGHSSPKKMVHDILLQLQDANITV